MRIKSNFRQEINFSLLSEEKNYSLKTDCLVSCSHEMDNLQF